MLGNSSFFHLTSLFSYLLIPFLEGHFVWRTTSVGLRIFQVFEHTHSTGLPAF